MHENQETSWTTGSGKSNPAGKGQGRKASTNVNEEPDCAVIPIKLANIATEQEPEEDLENRLADLKDRIHREAVRIRRWMRWRRAFTASG